MSEEHERNKKCQTLKKIDNSYKDKKRNPTKPKETDDEFVLPEPSTESIPPSPVKGQTAEKSQDKPGE